MQKIKSKSKNGFTLIELLVVITIIGFLSAIILVSLQSIRGKARDARRQSDIHQMMMAMELYYDDRLQYFERGTIGAIVDLPSEIAPYLSPVPKDPGNIPIACQPEGYRGWGNTGQAQKYCLWACLEAGTFFAASPKGTRTLESAPTGLDCW
jgi:prepilin-type N-terminal cleavage/methylation domain-containing protein